MTYKNHIIKKDHNGLGYIATSKNAYIFSSHLNNLFKLIDKKEK